AVDHAHGPDAHGLLLPRLVPHERHDLFGPGDREVIARAGGADAAPAVGGLRARADAAGADAARAVGGRRAGVGGAPPEPVDGHGVADVVGGELAREAVVPLQQGQGIATWAPALIMVEVGERELHLEADRRVVRLVVP